ncbi:cyanophycinase [Paenibacillus sp. GCM10023252]|uniref:cyanophycinase n=1 Tax=Paenibacillus sp. GCM10023252 TaxID=3252649 RepID=UPI0036110B49
MKRVALVIIGALLCSLVSALSASAATNYDYFSLGSTADVAPSTSGGMVIMGGSTDVDAAFEWMINRSGGGDFVILRASGTDAYNPYVYNDLGGVNSAETIIVKNRTGANDTFVYDKIRKAEALFIAGGDQALYVNYFKDTKVEDAINELKTRGVPIGGTSAGAMIMGEHVYDAKTGSVLTSEALRNPFHRYLSFTRDFNSLWNLSDVIVDTHFYERDRMGRLVTFLARNIYDGWAPANGAKGIGVDERTAFVVEPSGSGYVLGEGYVYFLKTTQAASTIISGKPLVINGVSTYRIADSSSQSFNLSTWTGSGGTSYTLSAAASKLTSSRGSVY